MTDKDIINDSTLEHEELISENEIKTDSEISDDQTISDSVSENSQASENSASGEDSLNMEPEIKKEEDFEKKYTELNDKYLRISAEFDNYRKRTLKERMEMIKNAGEDILINFLPVIDNLDRAKISIDKSKDIDGIKEGVELIYNNLKDFLSQRGIKEIQAVGTEFDSDIHEAITKIPAPEEEMKGKVVDVIEKGYKLHDKIIRYAKVVVGE